MSEIRPWCDSRISLGHFETRRELRLVDCTALRVGLLREEFPPFGEISQEQMKRIVWGEISAAFSKPVADSESVAEYAPTQVLAEVFKTAGFDGIKYKSLLSDKGCSFALFDLDSAKLFACELCSTTQVRFEFKQEDPGYFVAEDGTEIERPLNGEVESDPEVES